MPCRSADKGTPKRCSPADTRTPEWDTGWVATSPGAMESPSWVRGTSGAPVKGRVGGRRSVWVPLASLPPSHVLLPPPAPHSDR